MCVYVCVCLYVYVCVCVYVCRCLLSLFYPCFKPVLRLFYPCFIPVLNPFYLCFAPVSCPVILSFTLAPCLLFLTVVRYLLDLLLALASCPFALVFCSCLLFSPRFLFLFFCSSLLLFCSFNILHCFYLVRSCSFALTVLPYSFWFSCVHPHTPTARWYTHARTQTRIHKYTHIYAHTHTHTPPLQVVHYDPPQFYNSHLDWFGVNSSPNWNWDPTTGGVNRFATVFLRLLM
jgi:hypothetical protein